MGRGGGVEIIRWWQWSAALRKLLCTAEKGWKCIFKHSNVTELMLVTFSKQHSLASFACPWDHLFSRWPSAERFLSKKFLISFSELDWKRQSFSYRYPSANSSYVKACWHDNNVPLILENTATCIHISVVQDSLMKQPWEWYFQQ